MFDLPHTRSASRRPSQLALSVESGGEGRVVQGSFGRSVSLIGSHAGNTVLCLLRGQLSAQLVACDVRLRGGERGGNEEEEKKRREKKEKGRKEKDKEMTG